MPEPTASEFAQVCVDRLTAEPDQQKRLLALIAFKAEVNDLLDRAVGASANDLRWAGFSLDTLAAMTGLDRHTLSRRTIEHVNRYGLRHVPRSLPLDYTEIIDPSSAR